VGDSSVLTCPFKGNVTLITWKISPKAGGLCTLAYRADTNTTHTNCSNSIKWKVRPDLAPDLEVRQVEVSQEGNYTCKVVSTDGNFHTTYHLTVLAPPRVSLFCDEHGSPVCEAAAGKPPAHISWVAESSSTPLPEEKGHDNGTVTVSSRFSACSTSMTNVITCMVFHPAGNWSQSIAC
ncbi:MOR1B protein, partial [Menura novaehollandiae]|nr:MOR1B protein [Menura novaehollandiae]